MHYGTDPTDEFVPMEIRDEDQRLSKDEYDLYTYPDDPVSEIFLKSTWLPFQITLLRRMTGFISLLMEILLPLQVSPTIPRQVFLFQS